MGSACSSANSACTSTTPILAHSLGFAALVLILAEGGFTTKWQEIRGALPMAILLATVGVGISVAAVAAFAHLVLQIDLASAILLGAIMSPTDAAAIFSVMRKVPLPARCGPRRGRVRLQRRPDRAAGGHRHRLVARPGTEGGPVLGRA